MTVIPSERSSDISSWDTSSRKIGRTSTALRARIRAMQAAMEGVWRNFTYPLNAYPALVAAAPDVPLVVETGNGAMDLILRELELRARDRGR